MLSQEQIEQYHTEGYTLSPGFFTEVEVEAMRNEMDRISAGATLASHDKSRMEMEPNQPPGGTRVRRIYEPCTYYPLFRELSEAPRLIDCVASLVGPDIDFHYSKINMKPPSIGSVVEWHQDLSYYPLTNADSVTVLIYLDDADRENGCLQVIPRFHTRPLLDHTRNGYFQGRVTEPVDESPAVLLEGKAGSLIFMHAMTPHASVVNTSPRWRRTLILSYRAADAFPIFCGEITLAGEEHVRHVRGQVPASARFSPWMRFPVPRYAQKARSLYELQEQSRAAK